jgi:hypothetical protein
LKENDFRVVEGIDSAEVLAFVTLAESAEHAEKYIGR